MTEHEKTHGSGIYARGILISQPQIEKPRSLADERQAILDEAHDADDLAKLGLTAPLTPRYFPMLHATGDLKTFQEQASRIHDRTNRSSLGFPLPDVADTIAEAQDVVIEDIDIQDPEQ